MLAAAAWLTLAGCAPRPTAQQAEGFRVRLPLISRGYAPSYTILCMTMRGAEGARTVELLAQSLRNVKGLDAKQVRTDSRGDMHRLFYGTYRGVPHKLTDQFAPPAEAKRDLALIRSLVTGQVQPFLLARIVEMPTPDVGPPEWNLKNAPGIYTLQICYCFDKPDLPNRKEVAVAICRALRKEGEEAWYFHGDRISIVTVGHFGESALIRTPDGKVRYSDAVIRLQNKREEFKYNTECLRKVYRIVGGKRIAAPSVLIRIPRESTDEQGGRPVGLEANPAGNEKSRQTPGNPGYPW